MKLIAQNLAIEYADEGEGPVLLMLHGWQDTLHTFDQVSTLLRHRYRIVRMDMPGFGASEAPKETWEVESYVQVVKSFIEKLGIEPEVIIGHSFGGRVIMRGVGEGALGAKKLVLIGSAGIAKTKSLRNLMITVIAKIVGALLYIPPMYFFRESLRRKAYKAIGSDYLDAGNLKDTYLATIHEDLQQFAEKIKLPTLLIWGTKDTSTPLADGERLHELINGSKLVTIDGATHFVHMEQPERVAREIEEFVG